MTMDKPTPGAKLDPGSPADPTPFGRYLLLGMIARGVMAGHGFTDQNRADGTAYYVRDDYPLLRFITLDTVNPGGYADGSVGQHSGNGHRHAGDLAR